MTRWAGWLVVLLLVGLITPPGALAQMYRWVDDRGGVHYTEGIDSIPSQYRQTAQPLPYQRSAPSAPEAPQKDLPRGGAKISFQPGAQILVKAMVNGKGPLTLILDTGADTTLRLGKKIRVKDYGCTEPDLRRRYLNPPAGGH